MCSFTNRATGTTTLFDAGVPESVIQKRTGHKSLDGLRTHERVTQSQEQAVAKILLQTSTSTYKAEDGIETSTLTEDELFLDNLPDGVLHICSHKKILREQSLLYYIMYSL